MLRWANRNRHRRNAIPQSSRAATSLDQALPDLSSSPLKLNCLAKSLVTDDSTRRPAEKNSLSLKYHILLESIKEELQCSVCLDEFILPRLLQCGHSFCTECLKALQYTTLIRCPWCRVITKFPNANKPSVEDLPLNYSVIKVQDTIHSNNRHVLQCNVHPQEGVKYHCQTCDEYLCSECIVSETSKAVKNHQTIQFQKHHEHCIVTIIDAATTSIQDLNIKLKNARQSINEMNQCETRLEELRHPHTSNFQQVEIQVRKAFEDVSRILEARKMIVLEQLNAYKTMFEYEDEKCRKRLRDKRESTTKWIAQAQELINLAQTSPLASIESATSSSDAKCESEPLKLTKDVFGVLKKSPAVRDAYMKQTVEPEVVSTEFIRPRVFVEWNLSRSEMENLVSSLANFGGIKETYEPKTCYEIHVRDGDKNVLVCKLKSWENTVAMLYQRVQTQLELSSMCFDLLKQNHQKVERSDSSETEPEPRLNDYDIRSGDVLLLKMHPEEPADSAAVETTSEVNI